MPVLKKHEVLLYVDRVRGRWIVRDPEGDFWLVPAIADPWNHREPCDPSTDEFDLQPVPGHYKYLLDLPF